MAEPAYEPQRKVQRKKAVRRAEQSAPLIGIRKNMGFFACAIMVAALVCVLYQGIGYLFVHAATQELDKEITALTNECANLTRTNDEREQMIASSLDINKVYEIAVGQYGMVYPRDNEVIVFNYKNDGYVRQYSAVADEVKPEQTTIERILGKIMR